MIHILTIFIMIVIGWSIFSMSICLDNGDFTIDKFDSIIVIISKIYWCIVFSSAILFLLWIVAYVLSYAIICDGTNNDDPVCIKEEVKE